MTAGVYKRVTELLREGKRFALVKVIRASAGTPRKSGAAMIVFPGGKTEFTIGGGRFESDAVRAAEEAITSGDNRVLEFEFREEKDGMVCGGSASVFIEAHSPGYRVVIFGGGHIALALSRFLDILGLPYTVADDRGGYSSVERFPGASAVYHISYDDPVKDIEVTPKTLCVIVTHGHLGDSRVLKSILETPAMYIGMIGSVKKVKAVKEELGREGFNSEDPRILAPVGLDIGGDTPEEVALSIAAQMQQVIYGRARTGPGGSS